MYIQAMINYPIDCGIEGIRDFPLVAHSYILLQSYTDLRQQSQSACL